VWRCTFLLTKMNEQCVNELCGAAHPIIPLVQLNDSHLPCVALHIPSSSVAPLNASDLGGVALHIPSSFHGTTNQFPSFWCGAAHPIFLVWRCTSLHPPLFNHFSCVALHIPSSSCESVAPLNASNLRRVTLHIRLVVPWHYVTTPIILVWRCTSHHPPVVILNASHLPDAVLHIPSCMALPNNSHICGEW
jgi:hypothetical protein